MSPIIVITVQGKPTTPNVALEYFKKADLQQGELLGIFRQLIAMSQEHAAQAAEFVKKNEAKFISKTVRLAKEFGTDRPIGVKPVTGTENVLETLTEAGSGARFRITFRSLAASKVNAVTLLAPRLLTFDDQHAKMFLDECVRPSGDFSRIPRTYMIKIQTSKKDEYEDIAASFAQVLETLELVSTCNERVSALQQSLIETIVAENPDMFYDESVFRAACAGMNCLKQSQEWINKILSPNASMQTILEVVPVNHRLNILEKYVEYFKKALVV